MVKWYRLVLQVRSEQHLIWPKIHEQVATHVAKCTACQLDKGQKKKYGHLPVKDVEAHPWQTFCVDLFGPYTVCTKKGTQSLHAMTMFDPNISWFEVVEISNKGQMLLP
jgi:hypothetical protein